HPQRERCHEPSREHAQVPQRAEPRPLGEQPDDGRDKEDQQAEAHDQPQHHAAPAAPERETELSHGAEATRPARDLLLGHIALELQRRWTMPTKTRREWLKTMAALSAGSLANALIPAWAQQPVQDRTAAFRAQIGAAP